jgi:ribosomal protein S18 acetylase RimI-like enzyme
VLIKKADITDIEQLSKLFDEYRIFYRKDSDLLGAKNFLTERITNKESEIIVAENAEKTLMGFIQLYPLFSSTRMKRLWLLNDLYVNEKYRGKEVSVALMNEAKVFATKTNSAGLILETEKSNTIGNKLYPKVGFELDIEHNFYFWNT